MVVRDRCCIRACNSKRSIDAALTVANTVLGDYGRIWRTLREHKGYAYAAGSSLDRIVKITVLLARPDLYKEMNEAYAEFFPGPKPARAMARFGADIPGVLVAIEAIATVESTSQGGS